MPNETPSPYTHFPIMLAGRSNQCCTCRLNGWRKPTKPMDHNPHNSNHRRTHPPTWELPLTSITLATPTSENVLSRCSKRTRTCGLQAHLERYPRPNTVLNSNPKRNPSAPYPTDKAPHARQGRGRNPKDARRWRYRTGSLRMGVTNRPRTEEGRFPTFLCRLWPLERKDRRGRIPSTTNRRLPRLPWRCSDIHDARLQRWLLAGARSSRGLRQNDNDLLSRNLSICSYSLRNTERARDIQTSSRYHPERGPMADMLDLPRQYYRALEGRRYALTTCLRSSSTSRTNRCNVETPEMLFLPAESRLPRPRHHTR